MELLKTYEAYCEAFTGSGEGRRCAELLYMLRSYLLAFQAMDPQETGYITVDQLLEKEDLLAEKGDYLSGIVRRSNRTFRHIRERMRTNILRENVMMPIYEAREFNGASIAWLSRRPGRNVREKLAGTRSVLAVRRRMSFDTAENRLLKEFARRLEDALYLKGIHLPASFQDEEEKEFYEFLHRFHMQLKHDEIKPWRNTPPNNTLLADKNYNVIWRAWNELALTDAKIADDQRNLDVRLAELSAFLLIRMFGRCARFPQMPLYYCGHNAAETGRTAVSDFDICFPFHSIQAYTAAGRVLKMELHPETAQLDFEYGGRVFQLSFSQMKAYLKESRTESPVVSDLSARTFSQQLANIAKIILGQDASKVLGRVKTQRFQGETVGIDFFMPRPALWLHGQEAVFSGKLFYQHLTLPDGTACDVDCSHAQAMLAVDEKTVSLYTLSRLVSEDDTQSMQYMMLLFASLHREVQAKKLYFLYPDHYNEFQLTTLKRTMKMYYHRITALPRSLAAVFTFVKSREFSSFRQDDAVLVVDRSDGGSSASLIRGEYQQEVEKAIPESRGIVWERHPAVFFEDQSSDTDGLLLRCIEREELLSLSDGLFFWNVDGESWQHGKAIVPPARERKTLSAIVKKMRERHQKLIGNRRIWVLQLADVGARAGHQTELIDYAGKNLLGGVELYVAWRQKTVQSLWHDCLPNLAIKRLYGKFDLVKDKKFVYGNTLSMQIPVASTFVLPKAQDAYHFELQMENASARVPYEAVVEHKAFPLAQDTECSLKMRYTYGADNPYSLSFVPLNPKIAGFRETKVRWARKNGYPTEGNNYPQFPDIGPWEVLHFFPNDKDGGVQDILKEFARAAQRFINNYLSWQIDMDNDYIWRQANFILFCLHVLYAGGRSVFDDDCPRDIRALIEEQLDDIYAAYARLPAEERINSPYFRMLCIAGIDVDDGFFDDAVEYLQDRVYRKGRSILDVGFLLGDFTQPRQQRVFAQMEALPAASVISLLAKAIWRNKNFVFHFPKEQLWKYYEAAVHELAEYKKKPNDTWQNKHRLLNLEFIMAVFRLRALGFRQINQMLSLNHPLMKELYSGIENIIGKRLVDPSITRLELHVRQSAEYRNSAIPGFLYAMLVYITDDAGDSDIVISKIVEQNIK